jgi:hypothetical protein
MNHLYTPSTPSGASAIDMGMKMFALKNYTYTVKFLGQVDLVRERDALRARAISNAMIGRYDLAYKDFKRYFAVFGAYIDKHDTMFVECLINANMSAYDFHHTLKVLWIVFHTYDRDKWNVIAAFCMYNLEYYSDAAVAISTIKRYRQSSVLTDMMRECEARIVSADEVATKHDDKSKYVRSISDAIYTTLVAS